ncbi:MAG: bifunctional DNA-formamidopyrimidine glycosylase/DNA-(apurinic or apyrimidinic site) lyase [Parcubacteria group bacterium]|nr:bifunctional DNA-formamidopyrimidine glycosylase/DNA-(apurinic or apyrimidinic site) lyase [Parcubacteria group bacterium]
MPELPEVELTMRVLRPKIVGKRISDFSTDLPASPSRSPLRQSKAGRQAGYGLKSVLKIRAIKKEVRGRKITRLGRHGKVLFMYVSGPAGRYFALHLRMSGSLLWGRPDTLPAHTDRKHVHFHWKFSGGEELWFSDPRKFGVVWYGTPQEMKGDKYMRTLGPDAASISLSEFDSRLQKHRGMLKPLLLRQDVIAGLGNIIVDETLWEAKLHPRFPAEQFSNGDIARLYVCMKKVIRRILAAEGNTIRNWIMPDGREGSSVLRLKVYDRKGKPCTRCGASIRRIVVGSRGTHFCPNCQRNGV